MKRDGWPPHPMPSCYGKFVCLDDCVVSCAWWESCMMEADEQEAQP